MIMLQGIILKQKQKSNRIKKEEVVGNCIELILVQE